MIGAQSAVENEPDGGDHFRLHLDVFEGPFDLLLTLIATQKLDITEVSLSIVTDEFIAHLSNLDPDKELDAASEFILVAATLLDLKIAGLLPRGEVVDVEGVALLEARDLLFARLLQYRAFKEISTWFWQRLSTEKFRHTRAVPVEQKYRAQSAPLAWTLSLNDFAAVACVAFAPKAIPLVDVTHLHAPTVSIREQAAHIVALLRANTDAHHTFREVIAGITQTGIVVARFLAVLELYRHAALTIEQREPLGELTLRWVAEDWSNENLATLGADYDT